MQPRTSSGLLALVQKGSKNEVSRLLKKNASCVNEADSDGFTPLMEASMNNHISILSTLLDHGADVNVTNRIGRTALIEASARGHPAIILRLCQARPRMDFQNELHPLRLTALMEAASRGHDGVVFWLCEARATVDLTNQWGDTALIMAANNNRLGSVLILLSFKANPNIAGDGGLTALDVARMQGHTRIVEVLENPKTYESKYIQTLYSQIKVEQKSLLQEEVNYDASVSSRRLPIVPPLPDVPEWQWEESLEWIPGPSQNQENVVACLQEQITLSKAASSLYTVPGIRTKYPSLFRHGKMRAFPFQELPAFGTATWVASEPTRISRQSKTEKISMFETTIANDDVSHETATEQVYPILRLSDNGTWRYTGDMLSGNLSGTYEVFYIMTVSSEMTIAEPHHMDYNGTDATNRLFYLIRLTTPPSVGGSSADVQVVKFILGKQIVLGRLVMEMNEIHSPWWL